MNRDVERRSGSVEEDSGWKAKSVEKRSGVEKYRWKKYSG
jgi:hypothetical protein